MKLSQIVSNNEKLFKYTIEKLILKSLLDKTFVIL